MFRDKIHPIYKLIAIIVICVLVSLSVSNTNKLSLSKNCHDTVELISVSHTCPDGTYLEMSDATYLEMNNTMYVGKQYVICRCNQPRQPVIIIEQQKYQEQNFGVIPKLPLPDGGTSITL